MKSWDVIIIGGGIIGLSLSIELRKKGASVLIVERGEPGHEASRAAGGMLVDCSLETLAALQDLATASARMYPEFVHELEVESGIKVDLRDQGTILFPSLEHVMHPQLRSATVQFAQLHDLEPALGQLTNKQELELDLRLKERGIDRPDIPSEAMRRPAFFLKERSVDPRALAAAAVTTAKNRGVDFSSGDAVTAVNLSDEHVAGVTTVKTAFLTPKVVNCAGAWSGQVGPHAFPTRPVRGQMLCLAMHPRNLVKHVIRTPKVYLIPRSDGRLLIGTTVEEAGFDKRIDPATIKHLYQAALELVPKLADARILEDWAGLRPGTPDSLPILGATATPGYCVATGHFRDGILLAPITAQVMAQVVEGKDPEYDLGAFSPARFAQKPVPG